MYDAIIIGCGPAGLTAGIYLARAGKKVKILEKESIGGQMASSPLIENYPGYSNISGSELAMNMYNQAIDNGVEIDIEEVTKITTNKVMTDDNTYNTKVIIVATGSKYKKIGLDNEDNLIGKGIHFCALCDGSFYQDKDIAIIGGGNSAAVNAVYLSTICKKVYLIYRDNELKCEKVWNDKIKSIKNIEMIPNSSVIKINGQTELNSIVIQTKTNLKELKIDGMFEAIGMKANTDIFNILEVDSDKYFKHNNTETKYANIFVIGDCCCKSVRQIATAINDGAVAATKIINYLNK